MRGRYHVAAGLLLVACTKAPIAVPPPPPAATAERWVGGIQVNEPDHLVWGTQVAARGLDTVAVTVYAKQGDWDSANLWFEDEESAVLSEIRMAKTLGLKVVLILRVALDHAFEKNRFLWHGMIMPRTDEALSEWFDRYGRFVEKWSKIASREGVDVVGIGSEMSSLTNTVPIRKIPDLESYYLDETKQRAYRAIVLEDPKRITPTQLAAAGGGDYVDTETFLRTRASAWAEWAKVTAFVASSDPVGSINTRRSKLLAGWNDVIVRARRHFKGTLTYAANFDQYEKVGFWASLDLIGINAYFALRDSLEAASNEALTTSLRLGWSKVLADVDEFREDAGVPDHRVLFTELGYTRRQGATAAPWASSGFEVLHLGGKNELVVWGDRPLEDDERAAAMNALADVVRDGYGPMFAGVLYWKLSTIAAHQAIEPFVLTLDETRQDPMLPALIRFTKQDSKVKVTR